MNICILNNLAVPKTPQHCGIFRTLWYLAVFSTKKKKTKNSNTSKKKKKNNNEKKTQKKTLPFKNNNKNNNNKKQHNNYTIIIMQNYPHRYRVLLSDLKWYSSNIYAQLSSGVTCIVGAFMRFPA